jgi:hypothetical protein
VIKIRLLTDARIVYMLCRAGEGSHRFGLDVRDEVQRVPSLTSPNEEGEGGIVDARA